MSDVLMGGNYCALNGFQRCFCEMAAACHGGGPSLTDGCRNLLISPTSVEVGRAGRGGVGREGAGCLLVNVTSQTARLAAR